MAYYITCVIRPLKNQPSESWLGERAGGLKVALVLLLVGRITGESHPELKYVQSRNVQTEYSEIAHR
jgi:hypothetical protein